MIEQTPWFVLSCSILATFFWRALGVAVASRIDPNGPIFQWFSCVAYAMLAGLITRILLLPVGTLEQTSTVDRVAAMIIGFAVFIIFKRNVVAATVTAFLVFLTLAALRQASVF